MIVCIRADASLRIGSGHVMRCLTLAEELSELGAKATFLSRELPGNYCELIERKGFPCVRLPVIVDPGDTIVNDPSSSAWLGCTPEADGEQSADAIDLLGAPVDWLIVDHYSLDSAWERQLRARSRRIMVIDDLANRRHDCDLLLDQNYYRQSERRYDGLVPAHCRTLLGPKYALLRREFRSAMRIAIARSGEVRRILVFLGGSDADNVTTRVLEAFVLTGIRDIALDVVVGASNVHGSEIEALCRMLGNASFHVQVDNMATLMARADLAIGAGGATTWERCALGLPTLTVVVADNQLETTKDIAELGVIWYLGRSSDLRVQDFARAIRTALDDPRKLRNISIAALGLMAAPAGDDSSPVVEALFEEA